MLCDIYNNLAEIDEASTVSTIVLLSENRPWRTSVDDHRTTGGRHRGHISNSILVGKASKVCVGENIDSLSSYTGGVSNKAGTGDLVIQRCVNNESEFINSYTNANLKLLMGKNTDQGKDPI